MISAWAGWRRYDIPVDRYDGVRTRTFPAAVHQQYTGDCYSSLGYPAGKYLLSKISKGGQGQHYVYLVSWAKTVGITVSG